MTDKELFTGIAQKDDAAFLHLYEHQFPKIRAMVERNSGQADDALDVFQEGILALWSNIREGAFELKANVRLSTYLYALCRNIWISRLRKRKPEVEWGTEQAPEPVSDVDDEEAIERYDRIRLIEQRLLDLNESCQQLLKLFYHQKTGLKDIAHQLGMTEQSTKNKKYRCMEKLRTLCAPTNA